MSTDVVSAPESVDPGAALRSGSGSETLPEPKAADPVAALATSHDAVAVEDQVECAKPTAPVFLHSPPDSNDATKSEGSDSELSELDDEPALDDDFSIEMQASLPTSAEAKQVETRDQEQEQDQDQGQQQEQEHELEQERVQEQKQEPEQEQEQDQKQQQREEEEDNGEVLPDEWSGAVPIFRPTWNQFKDFKRFMQKVDSYGMKSGVIKIIPPSEWKATQPPLDELVKTIRVREPIKQDIMGSNGTYRQVNILHGRSYNVPQWRQLCEQSEHQPPARRGERRANADKPRSTRSRHTATKQDVSSTPKRRGRGRPAKNKTGTTGDGDDAEQRPMTPVSPKPESDDGDVKNKPVKSTEPQEEMEDSGCKSGREKPAIERRKGRPSTSKAAKAKTQSVSARRKYSRREGSAMVDEAAFKDFDYQMDISDFTPERCEELERAYWKTLTYAAPLYGADMMGTLFDDRTETWNLNKLPNLLDVLGTKIPGVNTAYLYLGMWKATFAWHLEDVDLYSINYLHFGAPKQWYSISQADARRFEEAMKSVWPADAKACDQFLRHKGFLISPHHLLQHYGIKVNKVVSYPGEFVVTYPYGYHSGYNLGYNCAEAVNFALDTWLEMGKIAKRCECAQAQDSVWINVHEIERKLRGEETEYEETDEDDIEEDEDDDEVSGIPTPPPSHGVKFKDASRKRKRGAGTKAPKIKVKKIRLRLRTKAEPPCCLCPNDIDRYEVLPTDDGRTAHRLCALYLPETYIESVDGKEVICNAGSVHKDRLSLKCLFCRSRRGACFQCSHKKCARGYHATCAAAGGVFVEDQDVPIFDENGVEYKEQAFEFSCRFHRARRDKKVDGQMLENDSRIRAAAQQLHTGDICQMQFMKGDIFAGVVVENRQYEETVLIDILPHGDRIEAEWKWLVLPDLSDYHLPKASAKALPMPASRKAKDDLKAKRLVDETPRKDDIFAEGYKWAEFESHRVSNKHQTKVDFTKPDQVWHYLGKTSTEARAQYTEDLARQRYNPNGNFLDTIPKPLKAAVVSRMPGDHQSFIAKAMAYSYNLAANYAASNQQGSRASSSEKPYVYKPRQPVDATPLTVKKQPSLPYNLPTTPAKNAPIYPKHDLKPSTNSHLSQTSTPSQPTSYHGSHNSNHTHPNTGQRLHQPVPTAQMQLWKPPWQIYTWVYQKYPFFQVHHNRDSSRYRSPYAPHGGFTKGYEADVRARSTTSRAEARGVDAGPTGREPLLLEQHAAATSQTLKPKPLPATTSKVGLPAVSHPSRQSIRPAWQVPAKVSPVPLPPHVAAVMTKPAQHASSSTTKVSTALTAKSAQYPTSKPAANPTANSTANLAASRTPQQQVTASLLPGDCQKESAALLPSTQMLSTRAEPPFFGAQISDPQTIPATATLQEFADVPGSESMQFMDRMIQNLRRASMNGDGSNR
ncbi:hypothetical protein E4U44_001875 [Claviceps purpurea]|nr:hypothetical protein E4U44_001875 [Claviceps purpurea]